MTLETLFDGSDPIPAVGRWVDSICPLPERAIVKSGHRHTVLQDQLDLSGTPGKQVLILAAALFPGPDLTRLATQHLAITGFSAADARHPSTVALVTFADKRWRAAQRGYAAWMMQRMTPVIIEPMSDFPVPGSQR